MYARINKGLYLNCLDGGGGGGRGYYVTPDLSYDYKNRRERYKKSEGKKIGML